MPEGHGEAVFADESVDEDEWIEHYCHGCKFYFQSRCYDRHSPEVPDLKDSDGNPVIGMEVESCCPCYEEGFDSIEFPCPNGHPDPNDTASGSYDGPLPSMAYALDLHPRTGNTTYSFAWMQAVHLDSITLTKARRSINCFDDNRVCWGDENTEPLSLPEIVAAYGDAKSNEDLLPARIFADNVKFSRTDVTHHEVPGIAIAAGFDAALLVTAQEHRSAYLLLRGAGFMACDGVIAFGLTRYTLAVSGTDSTSIQGYISPPDQFNRCWFFVDQPHDEMYPSHSRGFLVDQIPNPDSQCSSTTQSSSEQVALAAS